ncbi:hypothetical protein ACQP2E_17060 [Actinoplanes sp. CA-015351]|uniref:hypothetical protein n=1 Tax=Actinoplanes sp. CA-015351 TaxID=3239897 RepID=UPI003D99A830
MDDGQSLGVGTIEQRCAACGAVAVVSVAQSVVGDRVAWSVSVRCGQCGDAEEQCGWEEMPGFWRDRLVDQEGLTRLRVDRESIEPMRVRLLSVFRRQGATIADAVEAVESLTGVGLFGTPAEMKLLATRLTGAGAFVSLTPGWGERSDRAGNRSG